MYRHRISDSYHLYRPQSLRHLVNRDKSTQVNVEDSNLTAKREDDYIVEAARDGGNGPPQRSISTFDLKIRVASKGSFNRTWSTSPTGTTRP
ncbi:hypothetical protein VTN00DRAFT_4799 [Thermoascus crustaceus]|uniref:uncharacterized protein n=1 Tax=Thermoascus crustaceus TaxID=5088 RepID=UPI003741FA51